MHNIRPMSWPLLALEPLLDHIIDTFDIIAARV